MLIAGTLTHEGATSNLLDLWLGGEFELVVCPRLIQEVVITLVTSEDIEQVRHLQGRGKGLTQRLSEEGVLLDDPKDPPRVVPDDPNDDYLVALALAAEADFFVTRDRHFEKVRVREVRIMSPRQMIRELQNE
ncbi:MAG TPA: PIN domain-containing protein [Actinomycetota bacterium]|nr:PIN domain-containing protein [Actinomycetota bacterium]